MPAMERTQRVEEPLPEDVERRIERAAALRAVGTPAPDYEASHSDAPPSYQPPPYTENNRTENNSHGR